MKAQLGDLLKASPIVIGIVLVILSIGYAQTYHNSQMAGFALGYFLFGVGLLVELGMDGLIIAIIATVILWGIVSFIML